MCQLNNTVTDGVLSLQVTYIRSVEYKNPPPTLRQIDVSDNALAMPGMFYQCCLTTKKNSRENSTFTLEFFCYIKFI